MSNLFDDRAPLRRVKPEERPVARQSTFYRIRRPKTGADVRAVVLCDRMLKFWVHCVDGHDQPCTKNEGECPHCSEGWRSGLKGYLAGYDPYQGQMVLVELTPNAIRSCRRLEDKSASLRGEFIVVKRVGKAKNGPCIAELMAWPNGLEGLFKNGLPQSFDVEMALYRVWKMLVESHVELDFGGKDGAGVSLPPSENGRVVN